MKAKTTKSMKNTPEISPSVFDVGGAITQRDKGFFILRFKLPGGHVTSEQLPKLAKVAKKYGRGELHITTRQGVEIPWVKEEDIVAAQREAVTAGISPGASGPRLRVTTACPGCVVCKRGLVDSQKLAAEIDRRFFGQTLPGKFKIAVSGCPNSCTKPRENDIGFHGVVEPAIDLSMCTRCGVCKTTCKEGAIMMRDDVPVIDIHKCVNCGDCIRVCPTDSIKGLRYGYRAFIGGKMGRHPRLGNNIADFVDEERCIEIIERSLREYRHKGAPKERFGSLVNRMGWGKFKRDVIDY